MHYINFKNVRTNGYDTNSGFISLKIGAQQICTIYSQNHMISNNKKNK